MKSAPGSTYTYRGDGLRIAKDAGIATTFAWDESGSMPMLLAEKTSSGTTRYIYGPTGSPIARIDGDGTLYYHHDQLGSIRAITDESGDTVGTATYDPYGTRTQHSGITTPFGFAGEYTDTETGFQYLRARYYDPATATFLTRDPIEAITQEPYGYVGGNPLNYVDPSGNLAFALAPLIGAVVTAIAASVAVYIVSDMCLDGVGDLLDGVFTANDSAEEGSDLADVDEVLGGLDKGRQPNVRVVDSDAELKRIHDELAGEGLRSIVQRTTARGCSGQTASK